MALTASRRSTKAGPALTVLPYRRVYCAMIMPLVVVTPLVSSNSVSGAGPSKSRAPLPRVSSRSAACSGQSSPTAGVLVRAAEALHDAVEGDPHRDRDRTHGPAPFRATGRPAAALSPLTRTTGGEIDTGRRCNWMAGGVHLVIKPLAAAFGGEARKAWIASGEAPGGRDPGGR